jgi:hypothetical protein
METITLLEFDVNFFLETTYSHTCYFSSYYIKLILRMIWNVSLKFISWFQGCPILLSIVLQIYL